MPLGEQANAEGWYKGIIYYFSMGRKNLACPIYTVHTVMQLLFSPMLCVAVVVGRSQPPQIASFYSWKYQRPFADFFHCCLSLIYTPLLYYPEANADSELAAVWAISFLPSEIYVITTLM